MGWAKPWMRFSVRTQSRTATEIGEENNFHSAMNPVSDRPGPISIVADFQIYLGIPTLLMGFGLPKDNTHAPNEKFSIHNCRCLKVKVEESGIDQMTEFIPIELQLWAVVLAEELDFSVAAQRLGTSPAMLHTRIRELATRLECSLFQEKGDLVEVTKDGQVLIDGFRSFLAQNGKLPE